MEVTGIVYFEVEAEKITIFLPTGEPLHAHQAAGRLLLLRVRSSRATQRPRTVLRGAGAAYDTGREECAAVHHGE